MLDSHYAQAQRHFNEYFLKVPSIYFLQKNSQSVSKKIIHAGDHDIKRNIFEDETAVLNLC